MKHTRIILSCLLALTLAFSACAAPAEDLLVSVLRLLYRPETLVRLSGLGAESAEPADDPAPDGDAALAALREAGIGISDELVADLKDAYGIEGEGNPFSAADLLFAAGMGTFDFETDEWTPSSSDVYAFDGEVWDIDGMYRLFLRGVSAIVPGFAPEDARETLEETAEADPLASPYEVQTLGTKTVSFRLNGREYSRELDFYGDWFNTDAIGWINGVLAAEGFEGRLWAFCDGVQGVMLIYGSQEKAEKVARLVPTL